MKKGVPCDTVGMLKLYLEHIPDNAYIRVNGKKALYRDDYNTFTIYLDSDENDDDNLYGF